MHAAFRVGLAALVLGALVRPAGADMSVYYHAGSWDAFSGPGADGKLVCGIGNTNPTDQPQLLAALHDRRRQQRDVPGQEAELDYTGGHAASGGDADRA